MGILIKIHDNFNKDIIITKNNKLNCKCTIKIYKVNKNDS